MRCRNEQNYSTSSFLSHFIVFSIKRLQCRKNISFLGYWTLHSILVVRDSKLPSTSSVI